MAAPFHLDILAASVPFYRGDCVSLVLPTTDGEYGILANHSNAVGAVTAGELRFETVEGSLRSYSMARIRNNSINAVLTYIRFVYSPLMKEWMDESVFWHST